MTMQNLSPNPFLDFLEEDLGRRAAFFGAVPDFGRSGGQQQFFTNMFPQFENRYLGALGRQIQSGQAPTLRFQDFLASNFNPQREFLRAPTFQTGRQTSTFASPARFLFNL